MGMGLYNTAKAMGAKHPNTAIALGGPEGGRLGERIEEPGGRGCNSFSPDTPVLMADGTTKPIKDVVIGDHVLATDPQTGRTEAKTVTALIQNLDIELVDVQVKDARSGKVSVIHTTPHHRFWDKTDAAWTYAVDLGEGHHLQADDNEAVVVVIGVELHRGLQPMRNLTVADIHTYYVLAGTTPVLVHNANGGIDLSNATVWTGGRFPVGGAIDAGGPANGILIRMQNGVVTNYAVYDSTGMITRRVDLVGAAHGNPPVPTPHVQEWSFHEAPNGKRYPQQSPIALPAGPDDLPQCP
jgi:hypothetical protein